MAVAALASCPPRKWARGLEMSLAHAAECEPDEGVREKNAESTERGAATTVNQLPGMIVLAELPSLTVDRLPKVVDSTSRGLSHEANPIQHRQSACGHLICGIGFAALRESTELWESGVFTLTLASC